MESVGETAELTPLEKFHQKTDAYIQAALEYKQAMERYLGAVGRWAAQHELDLAMQRICTLDTAAESIVLQSRIEQEIAGKDEPL